MTTKRRTKVGTPRLDPTERLRHRFYEPLLLLGMLNPRRNGGHEQPTIAFRTRNFISDWRRFLDALAWFGDYKHGGQTVTAIAANSSPAGVHFWMGILHHLSALSSASNEDKIAIGRIIVAQSVQSSRNKIRNYIRFLHLKLAAASSQSLPKVQEGM
jgi:hypothetical protein